MKTPNPTEQLIKELSNEIWNANGKMTHNQIDAILTNLANQIHEAAAVEAEGRRLDLSKGGNQYATGFNQACNEDAAYHRSKVIK